VRQGNGARGISARSPQDAGNAFEAACNGIIHAHEDIPVMRQNGIRKRRKLFDLAAFGGTLSAWKSY
jgi:hypothetical protein